jgi:hypothetical protein
MKMDSSQFLDNVVVLGDWNEGIRSGIATCAEGFCLFQSDYADVIGGAADQYIIVPISNATMGSLRQQLAAIDPLIGTVNLHDLTISPGLFGYCIHPELFLPIWLSFWETYFAYSAQVYFAQGKFAEFSPTVLINNQQIEAPDSLRVKWCRIGDPVSEAAFAHIKRLVRSESTSASESDIHSSDFGPEEPF